MHSRRILVATALAAIVLLAAPQGTAAVISGLTLTGTGLDPAGTSIEPAALNEDVLAFTDRSHQWNGDVGEPTIAQLGLQGADYIRFANDDRSVGDLQAQITFSTPADVYVFIDTRISGGNVSNILNANPSAQLAETIGVDEGGGGVGPGVSIDRSSRIYRMKVTSGSLTLGPQGQGGTNMYGVAAQAAPPATAFGVTFDVGPSGQDVQSGHIPITGPGHNTNNRNFAPQLFTVGDVAFSVGINNRDQSDTAVGGIDWRDRGDSPNSGNDLVDLGEDFVKNNAGIVRLDLDGLPWGWYDVTSYHVDPSFDQCEAIQVFVQDALRTDFAATGTLGNADFNVGINNLDTADVLATIATFRFAADGVNPVSVIFDGTAAGDTEVPLNGFFMEFTPLPEPGTLSLLALGGLGAAWRRRRRR